MTIAVSCDLYLIMFSLYLSHILRDLSCVKAVPLSTDVLCSTAFGMCGSTPVRDNDLQKYLATLCYNKVALGSFCLP